MWKTYQWVWHRAQRSAAKEIIAMGQAYFPAPYEQWRNSKDPSEVKTFIIERETRNKAFGFLEMIAEEFEVIKEPKRIKLGRQREKINDFEVKVRNK